MFHHSEHGTVYFCQCLQYINTLAVELFAWIHDEKNRKSQQPHLHCYFFCFFFFPQWKYIHCGEIVCVSVDRMDGKFKKQKQHQHKHSGPKAEKKKLRKHGAPAEEDKRKRNPKAFAVQSAVRMAKTFHRSVLMAMVTSCTYLNAHFHLQLQFDTPPFLFFSLGLRT